MDKKIAMFWGWLLDLPLYMTHLHYVCSVRAIRFILGPQTINDFLEYGTESILRNISTFCNGIRTMVPHEPLSNVNASSLRSKIESDVFHMEDWARCQRDIRYSRRRPCKNDIIGIPGLTQSCHSGMITGMNSRSPGKLVQDPCFKKLTFSEPSIILNIHTRDLCTSYKDKKFLMSLRSNLCVA